MSKPGGTLHVHDWDRWQSYRRDRSAPPWIKVHRCLMRRERWVALTDKQRGQLVAIWLLAADRNGEVPDDPATIKKLCHMAARPDLEAFVADGWLNRDANVASTRRQDDANVTSRRRQHDALETEAETETEAEAETDTVFPPSLDTPGFREKFSEYLDWRRRVLRKTWKPETVRRNLAAWADAHPPQAIIAALDHAMQNEYQGVFPGTKGKGKEGRPRNAGTNEDPGLLDGSALPLG